MTPKSAKAKGRRGQQELVELFKAAFGLKDEEIRCRIMGEAGDDIPVSKSGFPFAIESKNTERLQLWQALQQAETNARKGRTPLLCFRRNRTKWYVGLELEAFLKICRLAFQPIQVIPPVAGQTQVISREESAEHLAELLVRG